MTCSVTIVNGSTAYQPPIEDGITWSTYRTGQAGELKFTIPPGEDVPAELGNLVMFRADGDDVFYGWIQDIETNETGNLSITAVDQLGYLMYKERYTFRNKRADEILWIIAQDFPPLKCSPNLTETGYVIPLQVEDGTELFDIVLNALDTTLKETGTRYTLYDDFGKLQLGSNEDMLIRDMMITTQNAESFHAGTSLKNTYDVVKIVKTDTSDSKNLIYQAFDSDSISKWGTRQYYEEISEDIDAQARADMLLEMYNRPSKSLRVKAFGDNRVRGGSFVPVSMDLIGELRNSYLVAESVTHTYGTRHTMVIKFSGDGFKL